MLSNLFLDEFSTLFNLLLNGGFPGDNIYRSIFLFHQYNYGMRGMRVHTWRLRKDWTEQLEQLRRG